jgi:hypothetical protein
VLERALRAGVVGGIEVQVDTSAAGFERVPCYFAWLHGPRLLGLGTGGPRIASFGGAVRVGFERVLRARPDGFVFNLVFPPAPRLHLFSLSAFSVVAQTSGVAALLVARRELSVCWLGIEARAPAAAGSKTGLGKRRVSDCCGR